LTSAFFPEFGTAASKSDAPRDTAEAAATSERATRVFSIVLKKKGSDRRMPNIDSVVARYAGGASKASGAIAETPGLKGKLGELAGQLAAVQNEVRIFNTPSSPDSATHLPKAPPRRAQRKR
jgi:hypothetical protein